MAIHAIHPSARNIALQMLVYIHHRQIIAIRILEFPHNINHLIVFKQRCRHGRHDQEAGVSGLTPIRASSTKPRK